MKLRVIAGGLGGRFFDSPDTSATHPMNERMRGSLFNILGELDGQTVLDPFSGSGALSYEAISRGAKNVLAIEKDKRAQKTIENNIKTLNLGNKIKLIKAGASAWVDKNLETKFDLILVDPPYHDMQLSTIEKLIGLLNNNGLMVISYSGRGSAPTVNGVVVVDTRLYGDAALAFYRKVSLSN